MYCETTGYKLVWWSWWNRSHYAIQLLLQHCCLRPVNSTTALWLQKWGFTKALHTSQVPFLTELLNFKLLLKAVGAAHLPLSDLAWDITQLWKWGLIVTQIIFLSFLAPADTHAMDLTIWVCSAQCSLWAFKDPGNNSEHKRKHPVPGQSENASWLWRITGYCLEDSHSRAVSFPFN